MSDVAKVSRVSIDQSMQMISDEVEIDVNSSAPYNARQVNETISASIGLLTALGASQLVQHIQDGKVDEYEIHLDKDKLVGRVRGRDAAAYAVDTSLYITFTMGGGVRAGLFTPEQIIFLRNHIPDIPGVTRRIYLPGRWYVSRICTELARRVGLSCLYQAPDYLMREDVDVNGSVISTIQGLVSPFSQFEPSKVDIWCEGKTLIIRSRQGLAENPVPGYAHPGPINTLNVHDARMQTFMLRAHFLDYIRLVQLSGGFGLAEGGGCGGLKTEVTTDETFDAAGITVVMRTVETRTIRLPDNATLSSIRETYSEDRLVERTESINTWDDISFDANCSILNSPVQRKSIQETKKIDEETLLLRNFSRVTINYVYDDETFMTMQQTQTDTFNTETSLYEQSAREVKTIRDNGTKEWEAVTSKFNFVDDKWSLTERSTSPGSGHRPGGSGRAPKETGVDVPMFTIAALIDNQPGARDVTMSNKNLLQPALQIIKHQAIDASGAWEYEASFTVANVPWLRKGAMIQLTGLKDEDGNDIVLPAMLLTSVRGDYNENGQNPTSLQECRAVYWSKLL